MANQLLLILSLTSLSSLLKAERNVFLPDQIAKNFLGRTKRANTFLEELKQGNIERECYEETCSKEEAREAFEDDEKTDEFWNIHFDGDQCEPAPCLNGGTCKDGIGRYTCTCLKRYNGLNCENDIQQYCKLNNGGCQHFCRLFNDSVICFCADGYTLAEDGESCVPTDPYPCGQIKTKKTKREASSYGSIHNSTYDGIDDDMFVDYFQNLSVPALEPSTETSHNEDNSDSNPDTRVVGGTECALGECPWQALLLDQEGEGFCGGTILNQRYILTAAHCINQTKSVKVVVGAVHRTEEDRSGMVYVVERILTHPKFELQTYNFDIALIELRDPIQFSENVKAACLPTADFANQILMKQREGKVSGFGRTEERGRTSLTLRVISVPYVERKDCMVSSNYEITENMFCAGYHSVGKDACQGDSGGPHVTEYRGTYFVTGIVSWGEGCAREGKYGIYTKVSKFIVWIKRLMARKSQHRIHT